MFFNKHIKMVIPFWKQKFLKYFVSPCFNKNLLGFVVIHMHTVTSAQKICTCSKDRCIPLLVLYICCEDIKEFLDPVNFFLNLKYTKHKRCLSEIQWIYTMRHYVQLLRIFGLQMESCCTARSNRQCFDKVWSKLGQEMRNYDKKFNFKDDLLWPWPLK